MIGKDLRVYREVNEAAKKVLLRGFPEGLLNMLIEHRSYIAGGAVSALFDMRKFNEYDIFSMSDDHAEKINKYLMANIGFFKRVAITHRANTYKYITEHGYAKKVQVILMPEKYGIPEDVIRTFDFRATMGAYDPATNQFVYVEGFKEDNKNRKLVYNVKSIFPFSSLLRIAKYGARGYTISKSDLLNMGLRVNQLNIDDSRDLVKEICAEGYEDLDKSQFDTDYIYKVITKYKPKYKSD